MATKRGGNVKLFRRKRWQKLSWGGMATLAILGFQNCSGFKLGDADSSSKIMSQAAGGNGDGYSGLQGETYYRFSASFEANGHVLLQADSRLVATSAGYEYISADGTTEAIPASDVTSAQGTNGTVLMYQQGLYQLDQNTPNPTESGVRVSLGLCIPASPPTVPSSAAELALYSADIGAYSDGTLTVRVITGTSLSPFLSWGSSQTSVLAEDTVTRTSVSPTLEFSSQNLTLSLQSGLLSFDLSGQLQFTTSSGPQNEKVLCTIDQSLLSQ